MSQVLTRRTVSTWSLHRTLGNFIAEDSAVHGGPFMSLPHRDNGLTLLELLPELAARGYNTLQICHFHLASRDADYLAEVRDAMAQNDITLDAFLIDDGDLMATDINTHMAWYDTWLDVAAELGAERARFCVGRSAPTTELLQASGKRLAELAARHPKVRIVAENWMESIPDAASLLTALEAAGDDVGVLIDLANWGPPAKYEELAKIAHLAETCHGKCVFTADGPDEVDFRRTLSILKDAGFNGPIALIYDGPDDDEWAALDWEWEIVQSVFA